MQKCAVDECQNKPRSRTAELCPKHYHRMYRHGSLDKVASNIASPFKQARTYRRIQRTGHPLAGKTGMLYEHRFVLYETIGPGTHACHWCGKDVAWGFKGDPDLLIVDHLNGIEHDNRAENLAPTCNGCNSGRAAQARALHLRTLGYWSGNDTIAGLKTHQRKPAVDPEYIATRIG